MVNKVCDSIEDKAELMSILNSNKGYVVLKFGADWCKPCKSCHEHVYDWFKKLPEEFMCYDLDVDDNFEIYAFLKSKKQVSSIPTILAWKRGNTMIGPDYSVVGADEKNISAFFERLC
tara:strand:- start:881 stop:1234 length:354 start_codon:yes stop_codon:yes gene_type:complete